MRFLPLLDKFIVGFRDRHRIPRLVLLLGISGGGLVSYSEVKSDPSVTDSSIPRTQGKKRLVVLGTGWAATSFLKDLDSSLYDVQVVSPRNYFAFTPLLPSVTCGTVEARSIVEPIRKLIKRKNDEIHYWEAECIKIDAANKQVHCLSKHDKSMEGKEEFLLDYDFLVIAVGAQSNTFNTPGVLEHCHFLKEVEDAQRIRRSVLDCFEKANLPNLSEEERKVILHFVVVGGGPTGVEFAAELHDFVCEDLVRLYPAVQNLVKITLVQSGDHILNMFDERISTFAEQKFQRDGIDVKMGYRVVEVTDKSINMKRKDTNESSSNPYGMIVWSTGIGTRPVINDFMDQIGQHDRRALATNEWLNVRGCDNVFAIGDCATIEQRKIMEDIFNIFKVADKDNSGTLTVQEFQDVIGELCERYPQLELYMKKKHMRNVADLLLGNKESNQTESKALNIEEFKLALAEVDSQMKSLPATAQVAAQQGAYLAKCFNHMHDSETKPEGPRRITEPGRHRFHPFRYKHFGQFAPLGGEQAAAELPGDWVSIGQSSQWLWYSVYASKQVSWRTRVLVLFDWTKRFVFGRDSSQI
ncbi:external alternative NAD(P)H-ubiquinone oxidoreductase B1, mitochondrial-like [Nymphaea colorata]|nr:external alternative NAD(P)H-ubiquinone oxidoreductase B1, mitochondrial-like [Nymphaea colorata]